MAKIFIITGHGAGDPGACGNGYQEYERVRTLAKRIKALGGDNVKLCDMSRNYFADNGISTLTISKDYQLVELHMDSASASARGGHVIIKEGYTADKYDEALADFIEDILPGRAKLIVPRNNLSNPYRAAAKGYSYRLLECGFITNATDVRIFNTKMDEIAKGILNAFDIKVDGTTVTKTENKTEPKKEVKTTTSTTIQKKNLGKVNITMQGYTTKWWTAVTNDSDWVGQADNVPLRYLAVKVDKGTITGRVYTQNSGWLEALTFGNKYDLKDLDKGVLGDGSPIQAIELYYNTPAGYKYQKVYYSVSDVNHTSYYSTQVDNETGGAMDGYAGVIGVSIDKLKAKIK